YSTTFDHLGDAVDRDHLLAQAVAALFRLLHPGLDLCHKPSLELQSAATGRVGERLHPAVVPVPGPVERHRVDSLLLRLRGDALADELGGLAGTAALQLPAHLLLDAGGRGEHLFAAGRGDLRVNVLVAAMHGEAHGAVFADPDPRLPRAPQACDVLGVHLGVPYFFFVSFSTITSS